MRRVTGTRALWPPSLVTAVVVVAVMVGLHLLGASRLQAQAQAAPADAVAFGRQLEALARADDAAGIAALAVPGTYTCPVDEAYPAFVCDGLPAGTVVEGFPIGRFHSEGNVIDPGGIAGFLAANFAEFASDDIRLYTVATEGTAAVLSTPEDAARIGESVGADWGQVLLFTFEPTSDGIRVTSIIAGGALSGPGPDGDAALVDGGPWGGLFTLVRVSPSPPAAGSGLGAAGSGLSGLVPAAVALMAVGLAGLWLTTRGRVSRPSSRPS